MEAFARLLGVPRLELARGSYDPPLTKATVLLYYLAYKGEWCSRDELLYLFYPDTAEEAFAALPEDQLDALMADSEALAKPLRYHVVEGYYSPGSFSSET